MKNGKFNSLTFSAMLIFLMIFLLGITSAVSVVNLGTAENFVVLSKSGISTTGTTDITGNIGVSPIGQTALTGFSKIMHSSNEYSTSSLVNGKIYASDYSETTSVKMTTAISDMENAYSDAAGRTNPTETELGAGDISGMTLSPGLYKWGTGLRIGSSGVILSGEENEVWIFQIGEDLIISNGAIITLSGGAQAKNIFWQVGGQTTIGTTSEFKGNILSKTLIEMNTGATLNGRALAQTAVTLDANTIVYPGTASTTYSNDEDTITTNNDATTTSDEDDETAEDPLDTGSDSETTTDNSETTSTVTQNNEFVKKNYVDGKVELTSGNTHVETELSIETGGNKIFATFQNRNKLEIKIMPNAASEIALNRLRLNVCSEENNCTIELKEVGKEEKLQIVYELKTQRESRIFGLFQKRMEVSAQVNAENGEIVKVKKPWWAFLASEKDKREE